MSQGGRSRLGTGSVWCSATPFSTKENILLASTRPQNPKPLSLGRIQLKPVVQTLKPPGTLIDIHSITGHLFPNHH